MRSDGLPGSCRAITGKFDNPDSNKSDKLVEGGQWRPALETSDRTRDEREGRRNSSRAGCDAKHNSTTEASHAAATREDGRGSQVNPANGHWAKTMLSSE